MIVAGAATGILSLYANPAFAASDAQEATGGLLGDLSHSAPDLSAVSAAVHGSGQGDELDQGDRGNARDQEAAAGYGDDSDSGEEASRKGGDLPRPETDGRLGRDIVRGVSTHLDGQDVVRGVDKHLSWDDVRGMGSRVSEEVVRRIADGRFGGRTAECEEDDGHGDDSDESGGYGDTPASPPSTTPPVTPPADTQPVTPPTGTTAEQPPSLAQTGAGEQTIVASGVAALLMTSGVMLYRRGRAASRR